MGSKQLKTFAEQRGIHYDAKRLIAYGDYQGYGVMIQDLSKQKQHRVTLNVSGGSLAPEGVQQYLAQFAAGRPYLNYLSYEKSMITAGLKATKEDAQNLEDLLTNLVGFLRTNGLVPCCKYCGSPESLGFYSINGQGECMCGGCFEKVRENLAQAQLSVKQKKGNVFFGIVGALLGSLIGVALWVLVAQMDLIAGIVGLVMAVCCIKGYEKFGGKLNLAGVILSMAIAVAMLYLAVHITYSIEIAKVYEVSFFVGFQVFPEFMALDEVRAAVIHDLLYGYVFMAVASIPTIISIYKNANFQHEVIRLP
jgi:hypothetical protein